jgi:hypothetical protein
MIKGGRFAEKIAFATVAGVTLVERALEESALTAAMVRRDALIFEASITKAAYLSALAFRHLGALLVMLAVYIVVTLVRQHHPAWFPWKPVGPLATALDAPPHLDPLSWILVLAIDLYLWRLFIHLARRFVTKEVHK